MYSAAVKQIADRYTAKIDVKASIFGGKEDQKFNCIDASMTGIALRATEQEASFRIGTIVEIKVPILEFGSEKPHILEVTGKVVRVEGDLNNPDHGKVLCGIHLVNLDKRQRLLWSAIIGGLKDRAEQHNKAMGDNYSVFLSK